jgi:DNA-directed RNA polymerase subunit RPC12/RpoP
MRSGECCPWCGAYVLREILDDELLSFDYDPDWDSWDTCRCPECSKPIKVKARTTVDYTIQKDEDLIEQERALYEKRMRGDWS